MLMDRRCRRLPSLLMYSVACPPVSSSLLFYSVFIADLPLIAVKVDSPEIIFIRLLHLLGHHPDFAISHEELPDIAKSADLALVPS
jgi:sister-chromatid-cohesion protein PDS5